MKEALFMVGFIGTMFLANWFYHEKNVIDIRMRTVETFFATVTAYSSTPDQTDDTPEITASGNRVRKGTIACPKRMRFGTVVRIMGKVFECDDRMNDRYADRFDVWMESREEAIEFGKRVEIVETLAMQ